MRESCGGFLSSSKVLKERQHRLRFVFVSLISSCQVFVRLFARKARRVREGSETEENSGRRSLLSRRLKRGKKNVAHKKKTNLLSLLLRRRRRRSEPLFLSLSLSLFRFSPTERSSEREKLTQQPCRRTRARAGRTAGEVRLNEGASSPGSRWRAPHRSTLLGAYLHGSRGTRAPLSEIFAHSRARRV